MFKKMSTDLNKKQDNERVRLTNIVGETKKIIMEEEDSERTTNSMFVSDDEVKKAVERINPDPHSLKSRG